MAGEDGVSSFSTPVLLRRERERERARKGRERGREREREYERERESARVGRYTYTLGVYILYPVYPSCR